jgi:hypothetical protein
MKDFIQPSTASQIVNSTYCFSSLTISVSITPLGQTGTLSFGTESGSTIGNHYTVSFVTETTTNPFTVYDISGPLFMNDDCAPSVDLSQYMPTIPLEMKYTTIKDVGPKTFQATLSRQYSSLSNC